MTIYRRADTIRLIAVRLGQGELKNVPQEPGIHEALRVGVHYHDGRAPNSIATLRWGAGDECSLQVAYDKAPSPIYFDLKIDTPRYQALMMALRQARFDRLDDQEDLPFYGVDLWLVERVAGSFYHDIVLCPTSATGHHREVVQAIKKHLPEAIHQGVN
jgi:hypothetical protein